jgi:hypothetical protein
MRVPPDHEADRRFTYSIRQPSKSLTREQACDQNHIVPGIALEIGLIPSVLIAECYNGAHSACEMAPTLVDHGDDEPSRPARFVRGGPEIDYLELKGVER